LSLSSVLFFCTIRDFHICYVHQILLDYPIQEDDLGER